MVPVRQLRIYNGWWRDRRTSIAACQAVEFCHRGGELLAIREELLLKTTKFKRRHEHVSRLGIAGPHAGGVELFFCLYFLMTGVHVVHMLVGLGVVGSLARMAARDAFTPGHFTPVELGGLYWHLVDVVWIFLYPLLYLVSRA